MFAKDYLKQSLMYQMSLGSKELYHSNVWAWLIENDSTFVKVFFDTFNETEYDVLGVSRECYHRDVIIWLKKIVSGEKYYLVIENKIKSLPDYNQLKGYTENLWNNKLLSATFTGIENTLEDNQLVVTNKDITVCWNFCAYSDIATMIKKIASASDNKIIKEHLPQILEYCDIVTSINDLLKQAKAENRNKLSYNVGDTELYDEKIRLADVFIKLKGAEFIAFINQHRSEIEALCPNQKGFEPKIEQSFHNGKATLDVKFSSKKSNDSPYLLIGVQIEGSQYRVFAEKEGQNHSVDDVYNSLKNVWFDDSFDYKTNRCVFGKQTSMRAKYDCYGRYNNYYSFVYQYYNITDTNNQYDILLKEILKDMQKASDIINSMV